ncbi:hypothetical protein [Shewanella subflava]|uniref:Imelysin-like domain-containing protein n=1 Tax=Shewanella subflava TaxID=2986476 RepID=A0ABT3I949_9GAMM|nr:hypothetical protein [Shewanella subflava]MCW3172593.1 hypothetical protein [Shewanella subflava]
MLKKIAKIAGYTLVAFTSIFALLFSSLVYINAQDRFLSVNSQLMEKWAQLAEQDVEQINGADNAFKFSQKIVGTQLAPITLPLSEAENLTLTQYKQACHQASIAQCQAFIADNLAQMQLMVQNHAELISQYHQLMTLPVWHEEIDISIERPQLNFAALLKIQQITEINALLSSRADSPSIINDFLNDDYRFWHNVFHSSSYLITFSLAGNMMKSNLERGVKFLSVEDPDKGTYPISWTLSNELTAESIQRVFAGEYIYGKRMMNNLQENTYQLTDLAFYSQWMLGHFFKVNDSLNMHSEVLLAQYQKVMLKKQNLDNKTNNTDINAEFEIIDDDLIQRFAYCQMESTIEQLWALTYNPIGKMLSCSHPSLDQYFDMTQTITDLQQQTTNLRVSLK